MSSPNTLKILGYLEVPQKNHMWKFHVDIFEKNEKEDVAVYWNNPNCVVHITSEWVPPRA